MIKYNQKSLIKPLKNTVLTIGNFDGLHLGHQYILNKLKTLSGKDGSKSVIVSFYPNPQTLTNKEYFTGHIDTEEEKIKKIKKFDIDVLLLIEFDKSVMEMKAIDFLNHIIVKNFSPKLIIVGYNHSFGFKREGDLKFLKKHKNTYGFDLLEIQEHSVDGRKFSSTQIRKHLKSGNIESSNKILGVPFSITGTIIKGKGVGRKIGFPTANIKTQKDKIVPKNGVYYVEIQIDEITYKGMCNIGLRPTVEEKNSKVSIEAYILNFNTNIYGEKIKLKFLKFLRNEKKFKSIELLKNQLIIDRNKCLEYCNNNV